MKDQRLFTVFVHSFNHIKCFWTKVERCCATLPLCREPPTILLITCTAYPDPLLSAGQQREKKPTHGLCMHMDYAYTWTMHAHGLCIHMDYAYTWTMHTHGLCMHMDYAYTWTMHTHGLCMYMDYAYARICFHKLFVLCHLHVPCGDRAFSSNE